MIDILVKKPIRLADSNGVFHELMPGQYTYDPGQPLSYTDLVMTQEKYDEERQAGTIEPIVRGSDSDGVQGNLP